MSEQENKPSIIDSLQMAEYVELLNKHDWFFAYSDDRRVYERGQKERSTLIAKQLHIDANFEIWNKHAPSEFRKVKMPAMCKTIMHGSESECSTCGLHWDTNDQYPPSCPKDNKMKYVCKKCELPSNGVQNGSMWIELLLWIFIFPVGLAYSIWRLASKKKCPHCRSLELILQKSPAGQKIIWSNYPKGDSLHGNH